MFVCLLLCFISMFAYLDLGFALLCALHGFVLVGIWGHLLMWLHPSFLWFDWMWPLERCTFVVSVCLMHTLSPLCVMLCLLALWHSFGFHCFFASLHACLHVHAWVCVSSILQSNGTMDTRFKPTFVLLGLLFLFDNMLFAPVWLSLLLMACLLACSLFTCFFACLLACFLCHGMYTWSKGATS